MAGLYFVTIVYDASGKTTTRDQHHFDIPQAPSKRRYPVLMALYTWSAQVSLFTFQSPKPTRGIGWPVLSFKVGDVMLAQVRNCGVY